MGAVKKDGKSPRTSQPKKGTKRAATTRLEPGKDSIERSEPTERNNDGIYMLDWSIRLHDGRLLRRRSQGSSKADARRRARATAKELLTTGGSEWKTTSKMVDFINAFSRPAVENEPLRPRSRASYRTAVSQILGECGDHKHAAALGDFPIATGTRLRFLEACIREIAELHGPSCGTRARTVLSKYVIQQLNREELVVGNPLKGVSISMRRTGTDSTMVSEPQRKALTKNEHQRVLAYLLELDPSAGVVQPKRSRFTIEDRIARRRNAIEITLLQATTGLRVSEANALTWNDVEITKDGTVYVTVRASVSKTHKSRKVPILDDRVAMRVAKRYDASKPKNFVIGAPTDSSKEWDASNSKKQTTPLYLEFSTELGIPEFAVLRTHVWRATLNTIFKGKIDVVTRAAYFGHDPEINKSSYTDVTDTSAMLDVARELRRS
ncbi:site-specific integrase [Frondihabitans sp. PhB188]|uniref:site-specific integrase n=1 Tax=Frondihabitans sp. PhB188 TaxID=2485200 RepID=UPI000F4A2E46|nr:site-specific integrase [Frondihabitans sp. PhB188]